MSFRLKTVVGIAVIEIFLLLILVLGGVHHVRLSNEERVFQQARVSASLLASMTTDAVIAFDLATLDELVRQAAANPGIDYARIRAADGAALAQAGPEAILSVPFRPDADIAAAASDGRVDVAVPIVVGGQNFGQVELGQSMAEVERVTAEAKRWMMSIAATEIVLVAVFGLLLGQVLTVQLLRLREGARRVANGEFGLQLQQVGRDELAQTTASFNAMSASLARYKSQFERALDLAEEKRAKAETRLLAAIEAMPQGVAILESDGRILHMNARYRALYSLPATYDPDGKPFHEIAAFQAQAIRSQSYRRSAPSAPETLARIVEERLRRLADPSVFPTWETELHDQRVLLCTQQPIIDGGLVLVDTDITAMHDAADRTEAMQRELLQKQKLESLGTLAGGIAHEINTPTQYVGDNLSFLGEGLSAMIRCITRLGAALDARGGAEERHLAMREADFPYLQAEMPIAITHAAAGIARIGEIVSAVKAHAYPEIADIGPTDINRAIHHAVVVTSSRWRSVAVLEEDLAVDLPEIQADDGQLGQVLAHLIVNAADAMQDWAREQAGPGWVGRIRIESRLGTDEDVVIAVHDSGPGVPEGHHGRIFDPFFTTKPVGQGTGQGLAICRAIVTDIHHGRIEVARSNLGGALFLIHLPLATTRDTARA